MTAHLSADNIFAYGYLYKDKIHIDTNKKITVYRYTERTFL